MILRKLSNFFKKISILYGRLTKFRLYSKFLADGKYYCNSDLKSFVLKKQEELIFGKNILNIKINKLSIPVLFFFKKSNSLLENEQYGTVLLFSNSTSDNSPLSYKFFNLNNKSVTTIYESQKKFHSDLNAHKIFSKFFKIPQLLKIDEDKLLLVEEFVLPTLDTSLRYRASTYKNIIESYISYYSKYDILSGYSTPQLSLVDASQKGLNNHWIQYFTSKLSRHVDMRIPICFQHGDLSSYNIIIENNTNSIYFIDYEHQGNYIFFYDLFWYMQNLARQDQIYDIIHCYLNGLFDEDLLTLFSTVNIEYHTSLKELYYIIFILEMYNKRLYNLPPGIADSVIKQLLDVYTQVK